MRDGESESACETRTSERTRTDRRDQGEADNNSAPECEQRTGVVVVQAASQTRVSESRRGRVRQVAGVGVIMVHESCRGAGYE